MLLTCELTHSQYHLCLVAAHHQKHDKLVDLFCFYISIFTEVGRIISRLKFLISLWKLRFSELNDLKPAPMAA